jgi:hypothetical protein
VMSASTHFEAGSPPRSGRHRSTAPQIRARLVLKRDMNLASPSLATIYQHLPGVTPFTCSIRWCSNRVCAGDGLRTSSACMRRPRRIEADKSTAAGSSPLPGTGAAGAQRFRLTGAAADAAARHRRAAVGAVVLDSARAFDSSAARQPLPRPPPAEVSAGSGPD